MSHSTSSQLWTMNQDTSLTYEATDLRQTKHLRLSVFHKNTIIWQPNTTSGTFASGTRSNNDLLFNSIFIHVNPSRVARTSDSLSNHYTKLLQVIQIPSVVTHNQWTWSFRKRIMQPTMNLEPGNFVIMMHWREERSIGYCCAVRLGTPSRDRIVILRNGIWV